MCTIWKIGRNKPCLWVWKKYKNSFTKINEYLQLQIWEIETWSPTSRDWISSFEIGVDICFISNFITLIYFKISYFYKNIKFSISYLKVWKQI